MGMYVGMLLIAFATLATEIVLTRLLSVVTWYHLAFFAVSTAMLGMTAGAVTVYLKRSWFDLERLRQSLSRACSLFAVAVPVSLCTLCLVPLQLDKTIMTPIALLVVSGATTLPFYFSGIAIAAALTRSGLPPGKMYAADLVGAALGCLFVLGGLELLDAPSLLLVCSALGLSAALAFGSKTQRRWPLGAGALAVLIAAFANAATVHGIRPLVVKGGIDRPAEHLLDRWNSYSRVVVEPQREAAPQFWGKSPLAPDFPPVPQYAMRIDGAAGTTMSRFSALSDIAHLKYDVTSLAYHLRPSGGACVIGVGGGRDMQTAVLFGHNEVLGVDVNPIFIDLLKDEFRTFAGLADHPGVRFVVDDARAYLEESQEQFAVLQMSLIDTWAATGAGAFSLSENALYTVEAWSTMLDRLSPAGIFTVSRWHDAENLGETGRVVSLAVATLLSKGVTEPEQHLAMVTTPSEHAGESAVATLLASRQPFAQEDIEQLLKTNADLGLTLVFAPRRPPLTPILARLLEARSVADLTAAVAQEPLDYTPPTDENPYFFNMLKLSHLRPVLTGHGGVVRGNLIANLTLLALMSGLLVLVVATVVIPLALQRHNRRDENVEVRWEAAAYFSAIGAGFMFAEIAAIQRLSVFLGHPVYGLAVLLFSIILCAGIGSFVSEKLPLDERPWSLVYPIVIALAIVVTRWVLSWVCREFGSAPVLTRIGLSLAVTAPLGLFLGVCFPTGMRLVSRSQRGETPWYWALNGAFGVLCSAIAVFVSLHFGISVSFYLGAACYALLLPLVARMTQGVRRVASEPASQSI